MSKNNKIIIFVLVIFVIIIILTTILASKNRKYVDNSLTLNDLTTIETEISQGKLIKLERFEKYKLEKTKEEGSTTIYVYNINDKYRVEVISKEELALSIKLINKVTERYVDIMIDSLEEFLVND